MKLLEPENKDYAGVIVRLPEPVALEGLDNLVGLQVLGSQSLVAKTSDYGELALVFTAGTQLSEEFAHKNNLYRHTDRNSDPKEAGYLGDNRHLTSVKFRGHRSDALVVRLESLSYIKKLDLSQFNEGDTFDRIGDHEICRKFVSRQTHAQKTIEKNKKIFSRVDEKFLPQHYDTDNYFKNSHIIPENADVTVTQKLHGTSIRIANTIVSRQLTFVERFAKKFGATVMDKEYDYVYGSRRAIKGENNPNQADYYGSNVWVDAGTKLVGKIPKGYLIYGELIGWTAEGAALQSKYTYQVPQKTADLYIYRVATINPEGVVLDMTYDQIVEFCRDRDLKVVPLLWRGKYKDFKPEDWVDFAGHTELRRYKEDGYPQAIPLDKDSPCDEGVVVRAEGIAPYALKCKSATFVGHDNQIAETGTLDMEEEGKV